MDELEFANLIEVYHCGLRNPVDNRLYLQEEPTIEILTIECADAREVTMLLTYIVNTIDDEAFASGLTVYYHAA